MAYLPDDDCYWIATGDVLCPKQKKKVSFEQFANIAKLGEACEDATCEKGSTCFTKKGETTEFCKKVLWANETGCESQANNECMQGLNCSGDVCVRINQSAETTVPDTPTETAPTVTVETKTTPTKTPTAPTAPTSPTVNETAQTTTVIAPTVSTNSVYNVFLYIFIGILVLLSIIGIIYIITRTTSSFNSSTYRSTF